MASSQPSSSTRKPRASAAIRLTHAAIMTVHLEQALYFYVHILGLSVRVREEDPIRKGRMRAMLVDMEGQDVMEIIEMPEMAHPSIPGRGGIHHVGFSLPQRDWHALRARMDAEDYPYDEIEGRLFVRDADQLILEIETS
ncbi:MAG: VOC family protein [Rhodothermales bacterium]|nr:VOC family protein [Rhodothermales bacterium]